MNRSSQVVPAPMSSSATFSEGSVGTVVVVVGATVVVVGGTVVVEGGNAVVVVDGEVVPAEAELMVGSASPPHAENSKAAVKKTRPMVSKELFVGALPMLKAEIGGRSVPNAN